ncbi:MAG: hypothetical protein HC809_03695 [Gammaproteobacteria bacterium]|nr:hypothetical protein [Gammaproteobacteria bacterium]
MYKLYTRVVVGMAVASAVALYAMRSSADMACETGAMDDDTLFAKATQLTGAGQDAEGFAILRKIESLCFDSGDKVAKKAQFNTVMESVGRKLARAAEAAGKFDEAERFYRDVRDSTYAYTEADEDRVAVARAKANRTSTSVVGGAIYRFNADQRRMWSESSVRDRAKPHQAERTQQMAAYESELQTIAAAQGDAALAAEEKAFTGMAGRFSAYPVEDVERAKSWYQLAGGGTMKRATDRAVARGDQLSKETIPARLEAAIDYYQQADATAKAQQVRDKAKNLGDAADRTGNFHRAADYYNVADLSAQADAVMARGEAQAEANEKKRKAEFDAGADDLEAELGF